MSEPREALRRIVVAGSGQVGLLSAIALRRALPTTEVVLLAIAPKGPSFADFASTALPFTARLHERLGIEEGRLIAAAGASHRLITRYFGWAARDQRGVFAHGGRTGPANVAGGARGAGSLAEVLADAGRFALAPADGETSLASIEYALRWNPSAYRALLVERVRQLGIGHVQAPIESMEFDGKGGIAGLNIQGQGWLAADLFVDCSGSAAILASALPEFALVDWGAALPTRHVLVAPAGKPMIALEDRSTLLDEGWLTEHAGRNGLQTMLGVGDGADRGAATAALGADPVAVIPVSPARVAQPWQANVIAIGDASAQFEPLADLNLDLAHRQLALLLEMLPGREIEPLERAEYNRRAGLMMDGTRDLLAFHYATPRAREVFGEVDLPETVKGALDQFVRRGRLPFHEEAAFLKEEEMTLLGALGFERGTSPQEAGRGQAEFEAAQSEFVALARRALESAPPYAEWIATVAQPS
tara:strand:+ start:623 stop:2044 length:1422 start_codon:yes stop_codon:yes gene_type:complete